MHAADPLCLNVFSECMLLLQAWDALASSLIGVHFSLDRGNFGSFKCCVLSNVGVGRGLKIQYAIDGDTETVRLSSVAASILTYKSKSKQAAARDHVCVERAEELEKALLDSNWKGGLTWTPEDVAFEEAAAEASKLQLSGAKRAAVPLDSVKSKRLQQRLNVFSVFDLDGSQQIEMKELLELGKARRSLGQKSSEWTEEKNGRLLKKMDVDGDGNISAKEFSEYFEVALSRDQTEFEETIAQFTAVAKACQERKQQHTKQLFDQIDTNNDGVIDRSEMEQALGQGIINAAT